MTRAVINIIRGRGAAQYQMEVRAATNDDLDQLIAMINACTSMYGIDMVASGLREHQIQCVHEGLNHLEKRTVIVAVDDNQTVLGMCIQRFLENAWVLQLTYINAPGNKFNASAIGGPMMDYMCKVAEARGLNTFYYVVRDSGTKRLDLTLAHAEYLKSNYDIKDIEYIPPYTETKFEKIKTYLTRHISGMNSKPLVVRQCDKKS